MNIHRNEKVIKRNSNIAKFATLGGLAVLAGGMYVSFRYPEQFTLSLGALLVGFILLLFVVGVGLIGWFYGRNAALIGLTCLFLGLLPLILIWLILTLMEWWVNRGDER